jgi:hypothetical protein
MTQQSHAGEQHPDEWRADLNADPQADQNRGQPRAWVEHARTAYEHKEAHRRLEALSDDELRTIPIVPPGERLQQGAVYIDLRSHDCREFKARGDMEAGEGNLYVPKSEVDYQLWNRLIGVDTPERTGDADEA